MAIDREVFEKNANKFFAVENTYMNAKSALREESMKIIEELIPRGEQISSCGRDDKIFITYYGGAHPEFDSNVYSEVYRVYNEMGNIFVETEDDTQSFSDLTADEMQAVVNYVLSCIAEDLES